WGEALLAVAVFSLISPRDITDGGRVTLTVLGLALVVTVVGAIATATAASAVSGRFRIDLVDRGIRDGLGPVLFTSSVAVVSLVLAQASTALLWAPVAMVAMLHAVHRAHVRHLQADGEQHKVLELTRHITADADLPTTAAMICQATRLLLDAPMAAMRIPRLDGRGHEWIGAAGEKAERLEHRLVVEIVGGAHDGCCAGSRRATLFTEVGSVPGCWLAVSVDTGTLDPLHRGTIAMVLDHTAVALTNARRGQVLLAQARHARHESSHDALTGLPNRTQLMAHIREAIREARSFGLLLIDLDDFKQINDAMGHAIGDTVLTEIACRLASAGRHAGVVARLGGDEFAAVIEGGEAVCRELARRLRDAIAVPVTIGSHTIEVGSSLGVASFPAHGTDPDELLKNAERAMYEAKEAGRGTSVFGAASAGRAARQLAISSGFRSALQDGAVAVAFQPVIELHDGLIVSVEALARWAHPDLGPIGPEEFVRVAEQAGLINDLTHQVLDTALQWHGEWARQGYDIGVSVNISARSLLDAELPLRVARQLEDHGVAADRLTLELTESSVISDPQRTMVVLHRLSALGVKLSIDDFGTGYSSLAYLRQLPACEVKMDKSLILPMTDEADATALVSGVLRLCHQLGYRIVAEGIETAALQSVLRRLGCDRGQGFHIARPMPGGDVLPWALQRGALQAASRPEP
ncbi:MAG TPA: EAL domain-containing protein, partial [Euzebya sp.]|nr:EAL domain-containing protein [Euzebya sp.]